MTGPPIIRHKLLSKLFNRAEVIIPTEWPGDYGFILKLGFPGEIPLVRIQSRCTYGEVFGSMHCDCRQQLELALRMIEEESGGFLFYLNQEGRGAGTKVKACAYQAAEQRGIDTFKYYREQGFETDLRSYTLVTTALLAFGIRHVRLLTNNPQKCAALDQANIRVIRIPLKCEVDHPALKYINAKRENGQLL